VVSSSQNYDSSFSYYIDNPYNLYNLGCTTGTKVANWTGLKQAFVVLDFGLPAYGTDPVTHVAGYGAILYAQPITFVSLERMEIYTQQFIIGYYDCASPISAQFGEIAHLNGACRTVMLGNRLVGVL
jgi:hypothetical protein